MAIPTVVNVGAIAEAAGATISPTMPASVLANDILLLFRESAAGAPALTGGTETWVQVTDSPQSVGSGNTLALLSCFWARASQDSPTSPTSAAPSNHQQGFIIAFRGCITTGNPWDVTAPGTTEAGPDTSVSIAGDTTTVADCLVVLACATSLPDAESATEFGAMTNADLANLTERMDNTHAQGNGGGLFVGTGEKASIGAYTATTLTAVTSAAHACMSIALKPPVVAGDTVSAPAVTHSYTAQAPQVRARVQPAQVMHTYTAQVPKLVHTVRPAQATHTYTVQAPQVKVRVQPAAVTHTYTAQAPQVRARVQPAQVTHTYTAQAPMTNAVLRPAQATHSYTGQVPVVLADISVDAPTLTHTYTAQSPQVRARVQPAVVTHSYTGQVPKTNGTIRPAQVAHSYTGRVPVILAGLSVAAPTVTHTYTGQAPQVRVRVQPSPATHSYTAPAAQARASVKPAAVTHTYTGQVSQLKARVQPSPATHSYSGRIPGIAAGGALIAPTANHAYAAATPKVQTQVRPAAVTHVYTSVVPVSVATRAFVDPLRARIGATPDIDTHRRIGATPAVDENERIGSVVGTVTMRIGPPAK